MDELTYGNSAQLLRLNGYAPAPLGSDGKPMGPYCVVQIEWGRYPQNNDLLPAVLTSVPALRFPAPEGLSFIVDHAATRLSVVTVHATDKVQELAAAIIAKHGRSIVCLQENGERTYVFRFESKLMPFSTITTSAWRLNHARAVAANSFVPLTADFITTKSEELAWLDETKARALLSALDALFDEHEPAPESITPFVPKPIVAEGSPLIFGNRRARDQLRENGYESCPIDPNTGRASSDWFRDYRDSIVWRPANSDHGLGVYCQLSSRYRESWLATVEISAERPDLLEAVDALVVETVGDGPMRISSDSTRLRVFKIRETVQNANFSSRAASSDDGSYVSGLIVRVAVRSAGSVVVLSGLDATGAPYDWVGGDLLTVKREDLPELSDHIGQELKRSIEKFLASGASTPVPAEPGAMPTQTTPPPNRVNKKSRAA